LGSRYQYADQVEIDRIAPEIRDKLGPEAFDQLRQEGREMTRAELLSIILKLPEDSSEH
jgi:hypothetical protein